MRLIDQRNLQATAIRDAEQALRDLMTAIRRKTSMPYGDGTRSDMVNATSDVLPGLWNIVGILSPALGNAP